MSGQLSPDQNYVWDGSAWQSSLSADGVWRWDGTQWQPASGSSVASTLVPPIAATAVAVIPGSDRKKRKRGLIGRFAVPAVIFAVIAGGSFIALPSSPVRMIWVALFSAFSGFFALCLLLTFLVRFGRGQRRKSWAVAVAVVFAVEALLVGGLNAYADSKTTSVTALVQDYYAEVAVAVSLGDATSAGHAPPGVTMATVQAQAHTADKRLREVDPPAELPGYTSSV